MFSPLCELIEAMANDEEFSICRLCLRENGRLVHIFHSDVVSGCVLAGVISELMQLEVINNNAYPQFACSECVGKLKDFKVFKEMCIKSKELLDRVYIANCESIKSAVSEEIPKQNDICEDEENLCTLEVIAANATLLELKKESEECPVKDESDSDDNLSCISEWEEVPIDPTSNPPKEGQTSDGYSANESADDPTNDESDDDRMSNVPECDDSENPPPVSLEENQSATVSSAEPTNDHRSILTIEKEAEVTENVPQDPINVSVLSDSRGYSLQQRKQLCDAFKCNECGLSFASREEITTHMSIHMDRRREGLVKKRLNGDIDSKDYTEHSSRQKRQKMEHIPIVHGCDICGKILGSERSLKNHKIEHERKVVRNFGCNICCRMFAKLTELIVHVRSHRGALPFPCPICKVRFSVKCDLHNHFKTLHIDRKEVTYNCENCGSLNADIQGVELTVKESGDAERTDEDLSYVEDTLGEEVIGDEEDSERFKCQKCGKDYKYLSNLKLHSVVHTDAPKFECNECGKKYHSKNSMVQHIRSHSNVKVKCPVCDKECKNEYSMQNHLKSHKEKRVKCNRCDKAFLNRSQLMYHMQHHDRLKIFECDVCHRKFHTKAILRNHKFVHSGGFPRKHKCPECDRMFISKPQLDIHILRHRGIKPFSCEICGHEVRSKGQLDIHIKSRHSDVERDKYQCEECGKSYATKGGLTRHKNEHHLGLKLYNCDHCEQAYTQKHNLVNHIKRVHL